LKNKKHIENLLLEVWAMGLNCEEKRQPCFDQAKRSGRLKEIIDYFTSLAGNYT